MMRRAARLIATGLAALAAGCHPGGTPPPPRAEGACHAERVQKLVGTVFTDADADHARRRAGARTTRVLPPNSMMTMDFRTDRLNIFLGPDKVVTKVNCG